MSPSLHTHRGRSRSALRQSARLREPPNVGRGQDSNVLNDHCQRMDLIASVSRGSGLEEDGDMLKESVVQEEFRSFIDKKLRAFWDVYGVSLAAKPQLESMQKQKDSQENILILFRKLREGVFAADRTDSFAMEVYETSLYLSVIFDSPVQITTILSRLVPHVYSRVSAPQPFRLVTTLVLLLHHLLIYFPSQQSYLEQIKYLVPNLLERPSDACLWISTLACSLRTSNFVQFEKLSRPDSFGHLLPSPRPIPSADVKTATTFDADLPRNAVLALVFRLRLKARDKAWKMFRNAYRELSSSDETQVWLGKLLFFDSFSSETTTVQFDEWVWERCRDGHLQPKEGVEGRWMVCKAR